MTTDTPAIRLESVLGGLDDPELAAAVHAHEHAHRVESIFLDRENMSRKRIRAVTDHGTECLIMLPRDTKLFDGAVLELGPQRAVVVRQEAEHWIAFSAADADAGLELGYFAGNMHWRVRFDGPVLRIAAGVADADVLSRLEPLLAGGRIEQVPA